MLQSGADWLQLACRVDLPHFRLAQLDRALGSADQPGSFQLVRVGTRGKLKLSNRDLALVAFASVPALGVSRHTSALFPPLQSR
jgi:hypothetical protein